MNSKAFPIRPARILSLSDLSEPFAGGFLTTPYSGMRSIWSASWNFLNDYYNHSRTHASLDGNRPVEISGDRVAQPAPLNSYAWKKHCGALFQLPVAA